MKSIKILIFTLLIALTTSCNKSDSDFAFHVDDKYGDAVLLTARDANSTQIPLYEGMAADGASVIDMLVPVANSNMAPTFNFAPKGEKWGDIVAIGKSLYKSNNYHYYRFRITADNELPAALATADKADVEYNINIGSEDGSVVVLPLKISVIRPAVIFAHGLASGPETFDPMLGYIRAKGLYLDEALYALDYFATSVDSYTTNLDVVPTAIDHVRLELQNKGYVNYKVTLVGHSMGGILTRLYIQNESAQYPYRDDIQKIITIDTPHSGSQLADFALSLGDKDNVLSIFAKMGAIIDLAVESEATKELNDSEKLAAANKLGIPTHLLTAHIGSAMDVAKLVKEERYLYAAVSFLVNAVESKYIYGGDQSDIIVPMASQLGGVSDKLTTSYITTYANEWHCSVHTTEQAADDVLELLNAPSTNSKLFTTEGFAPDKLSYTPASGLTLNKITSRPQGSTIEMQLLIGVDAFGAIKAVAYDASGDSDFDFTPEQSAKAVKYIYLAKLKSGEIDYMVTERN